MTQPSYQKVSDTKTAGFWRRVGGRLIDMFVLLPFTGVSFLVTRNSRDLAVANDFFGLFLWGGYVITLHHLGGQTLGKKLLGTRVVTMEGGGLSVVRAALRASVELGLVAVMAGLTALARLSIPADEFAAMDMVERGRRIAELVPALGLVNFLNGAWMLADTLTMAIQGQRRALHDFLAGTRVVMVASGASGNKDAPNP